MRRKGTVLRAAEKEAALEEKTDRWVYLNDLAERIAGQRESNMSLFNFSHADEEDGGVDVDGA